MVLFDVSKSLATVAGLSCLLSLVATPAHAIPARPNPTSWFVTSPAPLADAPTDGFIVLGLKVTTLCGELGSWPGGLNVVAQRSSDNAAVNGILSWDIVYGAVWTPEEPLAPDQAHTITVEVNNTELCSSCAATFDCASNFTHTFKFQTGAGPASGTPAEPTVQGNLTEQRCGEFTLAIRFPPTSDFPYVDYVTSAGETVPFTQGTFQQSNVSADRAACMTVIGTHRLTGEIRQTKVCSADLDFATLCQLDAGCALSASSEGGSAPISPLWLMALLLCYAAIRIKRPPAT